MSHEEPHFQVRVAPESLSNVRIVLVVVAGVIITVLSIVVVRLMLGPSQPIPSELHGEMPREIARIEQTLIEVDQSAIHKRALQRQQLESYGWVDHERGIVHIPIERAFDVMVEAEP